VPKHRKKNSASMHIINERSNCTSWQLKEKAPDPYLGLIRGAICIARLNDGPGSPNARRAIPQTIGAKLGDDEGHPLPHDGCR
jgi:hypothetical protein